MRTPLRLRASRRWPSPTGASSRRSSITSPTISNTCRVATACAIPTYLVATYVATSRLHENVHFASDVVLGAEGIIIGRSVTWHGRNFYASPMLLPKGAGIMVNVNHHH